MIRTMMHEKGTFNTSAVVSVKMHFAASTATSSRREASTGVKNLILSVSNKMSSLVCLCKWKEQFTFCTALQTLANT